MQSDFKEKPVRVDLENPEDPDLLVLGFQELDLSTEALLYSSGTAREDAWCLAVVAALGEKAVQYEKARPYVYYLLPPISNYCRTVNIQAVGGDATRYFCQEKLEGEL